MCACAITVPRKLDELRLLLANCRCHCHLRTEMKDGMAMLFAVRPSTTLRNATDGSQSSQSISSVISLIPRPSLKAGRGPGTNWVRMLYFPCKHPRSRISFRIKYGTDCAGDEQEGRRKLRRSDGISYRCSVF